MANDIDALKGFNPGGSVSSWLKFKDGDMFKVRLASLPVIFSNTFHDERKNEDKVSTQFAFIVYNYQEEKAQIWVTNGATYGQQIAPLLEDEEYGDWRKYDVKISRTGEMAQTRYRVMPGTKRTTLTDEQQAAVDSIDIIGKVEAGKGASSVMWLTEYREQEEQQKASPKGAVKAKDIQDGVVDDIVIEDIGDGPVNLDEIPF